MSKLGQEKIIVGATVHPLALLAGQRVVPVKPRRNGHLGSFYRSPQEYAGGGSDGPACVVSDGAGGYRYNFAGSGRCDFLWQIDF